MNKTHLNLFKVVLIAVIGGLISRWHGSSIGGAKILKNMAWGLPFGLAAFFVSGIWWYGVISKVFH
jgi:hypothetical protein